MNIKGLICILLTAAFGPICFAKSFNGRSVEGKTGQPSKDISSTTPRTVMVQLFEWPWKSIAQECEVYLGPNGFSAVQISPPHEHIRTGKNTWWERYQVASYQLKSRGGSEADLKDMISRCKRAGVEIYADFIVNHMAGFPSGVGFAGTNFTEYEYPDLYTYGDFNHCGRNGNDMIVNFFDRYEVQFCELFGLSDLKTGSDKVQRALSNYMATLMSLGVQGFRLDAAKHVPASDITQILRRLQATPYIISETLIANNDPIQLAEYMEFGDVNFFPYSMDLGKSFLDKELSGLPFQFLNYPSSQYSVVFIENHDLERHSEIRIPRLRTHPNEHRLAQIFMLAWPYGYPQIFSGYDFKAYDDGPPVDANGNTIQVLAADNACIAPWTCNHRNSVIKQMVGFRNYTDSQFYALHLNSDTELISFSRGNLGHVIINLSNNNKQAYLPTNLAPGTYCNVLDPQFGMGKVGCTTGITVSPLQSIWTDIPAMSAIVLRSDYKILDPVH